MNRTAAMLVLCLGLTESTYAGRPLPSPPHPQTPVQIAQILEALPQGEKRKGVPPESESSTLAGADQEFVRNALAAVTTEARIGKLVAELGATEELRSLGNELFVSQSLNAAALREAARLKNFEAEIHLSAEQEAAISSFRLKTPETLSAAFQEYVNSDRSGSIPIFAQGAKAATDPGLRTLAEQVLGELKTERPTAAAAIATTAAKNRPAANVANQSQVRPKAAVLSGAAPPAKAAKAKAAASAAPKPPRVSTQVPTRTDTSQNALPASPSTAADGTLSPPATARSEPRPFRTERRPSGRIRMSPMISADVAEPQALPPRRVFRQEIFRSSGEETDD